MNTPLDPVLASLSSEDAKVLDDIIAKASDATAFTTVFKAYSEVLRERGLDPGEDVVYYKQLLKLGVVKGVNWGAKWKIVKARLPVAPLSVRLPEKSLSSLSSVPLDSDDVFLSKNINDSTTYTKISSNNVSIFSPGTPERNPPKGYQGYQTQHKITSGLGFSSSPSKGNRQSNSSYSHRLHPLRSLGYRTPTKHPTNSSTGVVNDNEAWKKIEETRLSQDADHFRRQSLLSTCFQTWRRGLEWIRVSSLSNRLSLLLTIKRNRSRILRLTKPGRIFNFEYILSDGEMPFSIFDDKHGKPRAWKASECYILRFTVGTNVWKNVELAKSNRN